jgi:pimeloyl-ACP methyl ester carboxylesterase
MIAHRFWIGLALLAVLASVVFTFHYAAFGWQQCHPPRASVSDAERAQARIALPGLEEASFATRDGVTLRGWFVPPKNGVVVILVHGLGGNRASLLPEAELMVRHRYGVLLSDSRASGESGGVVATWGVREAFDIAEAVRFVRARPEVRQVALLGFSVGASAVVRAAANDPSVGAVVLYACWPSLREEIAHKAGNGNRLAAQAALFGFRVSGTDIDAIRPAQDLAHSRQPLIFVSGGRDEDTPPAVMDQLFALASEPKQLWRLPEVGHGGYYQAQPAEYEKRVIGFLDHAFLR